MLPPMPGIVRCAFRESCLSAMIHVHEPLQRRPQPDPRRPPRRLECCHGIAHDISPANVHDSQPTPSLIREAKTLEPELVEVLGDKAYTGDPIQSAAAGLGVKFTVVSHHSRPATFVPLPRRWVVERSFAWLGRNRRLSKDYERTILSSGAMVDVATVRLLLHRAA